MISQTFNEDCMQLMARYPDKHFDLAVVDPPYGINAVEVCYKNRGGYLNPNEKYAVKKANHKIKNWDSAPPTAEYWAELFRVSKNQIVFGGNYFTNYLPVSSGWFFWDKDVSADFAKGELAWTSFSFALKKVLYVWNGFRQGQTVGKLAVKGGNWASGNPCNLEKREHPTQKPIALYDWVFAEFAKPNDLILDTHLGSGSSRIAANKAGLDFVGCELDSEYFDAAEKRYQNFISQIRMF